LKGSSPDELEENRMLGMTTGSRKYHLGSSRM
jgi:hypothetical protein